MRLYEYEAFPNPRRVRMFLAEKGITLDRVQVDVPNGEHKKPAFLLKNPAGAVPVLELDDGICISETNAICRYLEEIAPENTPLLLGRDAREKAEIEMWQKRIEDGLLGTLLTYFHHATAGLGDTERYRNLDWGQHNLSRTHDGLRLLETRLSESPFVSGENYGVADITALAAIDLATVLGVDIPENHANTRSWHDRVSARASAAA